MSSESGRNTGRSFDSHKGKMYTRRKICTENKEAIVPVWDNINPNKTGDCGGQGNDGDHHAVGKCNMTPGQKGDMRSKCAQQRPVPYRCGICQEPAHDETTSLCGHVFCRECIDSKLKEKPVCPICQSSFHEKIRLRPCAEHGRKCEERALKIKNDYIKKSRQVLGYLKKKGVRFSESLLDLGNSLCNVISKPSTQYALGVIIILIFLIWYGVLPKIKWQKFLFDLYTFIKDYDYLDRATPGETDTLEVKTIYEEKLPCTVGCHPDSGNRLA